MAPRQQPQLGLFADSGLSKPSEAFTSHIVEVLDQRGRVVPDTSPEAFSVRVRLRLATEKYEELLPTGSLTYGECAEWEDPCKLYGCRYRLEDSIEYRTRRAIEQDPEEGPELSDYEGPRTIHGGYYSDAELGAGYWCALQLADTGESSVHELADMYGMTRAAVQSQILDPAIEAAGLADYELDDTLESIYGDKGRQHKFKFEVPDDNITSTEVKKIVVPGEVKRGRQALRVGRRRSRKDKWEGVTRVIPAEFQDRVDTRLLNPMGPLNKTPSHRPMGELLAARAAARARANAEQE